MTIRRRKTRLADLLRPYGRTSLLALIRPYLPVRVELSREKETVR